MHHRQTQRSWRNTRNCFFFDSGGRGLLMLLDQPSSVHSTIKNDLIGIPTSNAA
jgi:hypothetical protein